MRYFQFTLGPVQSFVAQARRTRDFWAGSFLLSYLTGQAMLAVLKHSEGEIVFPAIRDTGGNIIDPLLKALAVGQEGKLSRFPIVGSIPNRFLAQVPDDFKGQCCVEAVNKAWQAIAEQIWEKYVAPVAGRGCGTEEIWNRQVKNFWEMSWVFGEDADLLDRRKNWRSHIPPEEPGDKCTLMGNWQELSSYMRIGDKGRQRRFWEKLGDKTPGEDLRNDERLCSIALIKRLFPHVLTGRAVVYYPSTPYLAAVPWLSGIISDPAKHETARRLVGSAHPKMLGHENSAAFFNKNDLDAELGKFFDLDGNCFFQSTLENDNLWPNDVSKECRRHMAELLEQFKTEADPFYALLIMDGDRIGSLLDQEDKRVDISRALSNFSGRVEGIISGHQGVTVYAGGDDVLALLPMDKALEAAAVLRDCYTKCFTTVGIKATISAAIVYAHHHAPLRQIIGKAHQVLDEEAKEKTGRDALAVAVWKTGGTVINWSVPWEVRHAGDDKVSVIEKVNSLAGQYGSKQLSNSWLYGIRRLLGNSRGNYFELPEKIDIPKLLAADLARNREMDISIKKAEELAQDLLSICLSQRRNSAGEVVVNKKAFSLDGALFIKFLATKGVAL
ncbi:type III-B CRISPR-associated protein Cas10/Cmr2 [Pelotomaculum terephthalicicum JT]|uniref:type III-B CRISPR-associated protein Cas10/Cmr2 n=1 Tax=Pelotomaculum TaxID=191373 RepID=UPI0009C8DFF8|nr:MULTISPECIES: type III-B CRISPR-associated protein Cas10/Cmr2 [Pelotomaculum]MCG9968435.1 type III-B CRISPR-associated protein Cas10/Cmr2 [Pelotomaculum terephthalicicum JT]OPX87187.1 MAG: CRISPR-associated protein [Pelotomaculum sp. PtaB.Bin117]OPY60873.1 MAG: CRISPR-associated protein [Pelotomaculum sp. PtaU1.Bin065]